MLIFVGRFAQTIKTTDVLYVLKRVSTPYRFLPFLFASYALANLQEEEESTGLTKNVYVPIARPDTLRLRRVPGPTPFWKALKVRGGNGRERR